MENQNRVMWLVMAVGTALVVLGVIFSVLIGSIEIPIGTIWEAISGFDSENSMHLLVVKMRLPRAVGGDLSGDGACGCRCSDAGNYRKSTC